MGIRDYGQVETYELHKTIKAYNETATRQARLMIGMTFAIIVLTVVSLIGTAVQIYLVMK